MLPPNSGRFLSPEQVAACSSDTMIYVLLSAGPDKGYLLMGHGTVESYDSSSVTLRSTEGESRVFKTTTGLLFAVVLDGIPRTSAE